ncbi:MAG: type II secretion system F family protein [bacterium]|nr:type II secretion system F family protein [bacterium]MDZ4205933.1 type II secretion system F family protein [Patescibacteria group bacterium]
MLFNYKALENSGKLMSGSIEAISLDVAVGSLQRRGLTISKIEPAEKESWLSKIRFGSDVSHKDVVILSRQMAILFEAQVSALKIFTLLSSELENNSLKKNLTQVADDLQAGSSISKALAKHPAIFSDFYVNMVRSGEETGKLNETFNHLADYLDRNYEVVSKAQNALIYPAFVITVFAAVMVLMFTVIIPKISLIIIESGQAVPFYSRIVFAVSDFLISYGVIMLVALVIFGFFIVRYTRTAEGRSALARFKLTVPYAGSLYKKLYLSIISDNMSTMVLSGIPMVKVIEVTAAVVGNEVYKQILGESLLAVEGGSSFSQSLSQYEEIPSMLVQMIRIGEESGELGSILGTMAHFYQREVMNAVDTLVSLIEPVMIVLLGLGVGVLLASVLIPIYDVANSAGL